MNRAGGLQLKLPGGRVQAVFEFRVKRYTQPSLSEDHAKQETDIISPRITEAWFVSIAQEDWNLVGLENAQSMRSLTRISSPPPIANAKSVELAVSLPLGTGIVSRPTKTVIHKSDLRFLVARERHGHYDQLLFRRAPYQRSYSSPQRCDGVVLQEYRTLLSRI